MQTCTGAAQLPQSCKLSSGNINLASSFSLFTISRPGWRSTSGKTRLGNFPVTDLTFSVCPVSHVWILLSPVASCRDTVTSPPSPPPLSLWEFPWTLWSLQQPTPDAQHTFFPKPSTSSPAGVILRCASMTTHDLPHTLGQWVCTGTAIGATQMCVNPKPLGWNNRVSHLPSPLILHTGEDVYFPM